MRTSTRIRWRDSIQTRQIIGFSVIILCMLLFSTLLQWRAMELASRATYEKMSASTGYFLSTFENEMVYIQQLQVDFFNDRRLPFLESPEVNISEYERRDALLSVQERLQTVAGVSNLIKNAILCLPESGYWITPSGIRRTTEENMEEMARYLTYEKGGICFDGNDFFVIRSGSSQSSSTELPRCILLIFLDTNQIRSDLKELQTSESEGSFFYNEGTGILLSGTDKEKLEKNIFQSLRRDDVGEYLGVQRVWAEEGWYLVTVGGRGSLGVFVQYSEEFSVMHAIYAFRWMMGILIVVMIAMAVFFIIYQRRAIYTPIHILLQAFSKLESGDWSGSIHYVRRDEFGQLYDGFNKMKERIHTLIEEVYVQKNLAQKAQLKQLQAQINPHFLYNSFFILSRRIKRGDVENAVYLAEHLGDYFRFLTRNESDDIALHREVEHAKSYAAIQSARFSDRICVEFGELPKDVEGIEVPRLILQPLLENAFGHGLYNKEENGMLKISFVQTEEQIMIHVEDNGEELSEEKLQHLCEATEAKDDGKITGLINIHKRLQYYFRNKGGLIFSRSNLGGLKVTLYIPKGE